MKGSQPRAVREGAVVLRRDLVLPPLSDESLEAVPLARMNLSVEELENARMRRTACGETACGETACGETQDSLWRDSLWRDPGHDANSGGVNKPVA